MLSSVVLLSPCRVNQVYDILDEVGSWNGSWQDICSSVHRLADQGDCVDLQDRISDCALPDGMTICTQARE